MPRWTDLTSDQAADVRVARDLVAYEGEQAVDRYPLNGVGVAQLRPIFGAAEDDPMYEEGYGSSPSIPPQRPARRAVSGLCAPTCRR